jgi:hypothetical protein
MILTRIVQNRAPFNDVTCNTIQPDDYVKKGRPSQEAFMVSA